MADDKTSPIITSVSGPTTIDISNGNALATFTVTAEDDSSGVSSVSLSFDKAFQTTSGTTGSIILGDSQDFADKSSTVSIGIAANTTPGVYTLAQAYVSDNASNSSGYNGAQLKQIGISYSFTVVNNAPRNGPQLTALTAPAVDVSHGDANATFTLGAFDTVANITQVTLTFDKPLHVEFQYGSAPIFSPHPGGPTDTTTVNAYTTYRDDGASLVLSGSGAGYSIAVPIGTETPDGTYTVTSATLTDSAGNKSSYTEAQLEALGINTHFTVAGDHTAPTLTALSLPSKFATPNDAQYSFSAAATDAGTGVERIDIQLDRPLSTVTGASNILTPYYAPGGGSPISMFPTVLTTAAVGTYHVTGVTVTDVVGNSQTYTPDALKALGLTSEFTVRRAPAEDFNGDGYSDILWQHSNGSVSTWSAAAAQNSGADTIHQATYNASVDPSWSAIETFDFNGDGRADVLWRNSNGDIAIWNGSTNGLQQSSYVDSTMGSSWHVAGAADLNGDGRGDLLFRNDDGSLKVWFSQGTGFLKDIYAHNSPGANWQVEGLADFNGDGRADILWRNANGALSTWTSAPEYVDQGNLTFQENSWSHAPIDRSWHVVGLGDFNGDGQADILWRNDNGSVSAWTSTGSGFAENSFNAFAAPGWDVAQVGDFNGDGLSDILWRNANGSISIWHSDGHGWVQNTYSDSSVGGAWSIAGHDFPL